MIHDVQVRQRSRRDKLVTVHERSVRVFVSHGSYDVGSRGRWRDVSRVCAEIFLDVYDIRPVATGNIGCSWRSTQPTKWSSLSHTLFRDRSWLWLRLEQR